jgi:hypothetical protein
MKSITGLFENYLKANHKPVGWSRLPRNHTLTSTCMAL